MITARVFSATRIVMAVLAVVVATSCGGEKRAAQPAAAPPSPKLLFRKRPFYKDYVAYKLVVAQ
jgi:hypothetical protein